MRKKNMHRIYFKNLVPSFEYYCVSFFLLFFCVSIQMHGLLRKFIRRRTVFQCLVCFVSNVWMLCIDGAESRAWFCVLGCIWVARDLLCWDLVISTTSLDYELCVCVYSCVGVLFVFMQYGTHVFFFFRIVYMHFRRQISFLCIDYNYIYIDLRVCVLLHHHRQHHNRIISFLLCVSVFCVLFFLLNIRFNFYISCPCWIGWPTLAQRTHAKPPFSQHRTKPKTANAIVKQYTHTHKKPRVERAQSTCQEFVVAFVLFLIGLSLVLCVLCEFISSSMYIYIYLV